MKILYQFLIILGFSLLGETLSRLIPLPIPAAIYGLVLIFLALNFKIIRLEQVQTTSAYLIDIMPILFVSPAVNLIEYWDIVKPNLAALAVIMIAATVLTFGAAGVVAQLVMDKGGKKNG